MSKGNSRRDDINEQPAKEEHRAQAAPQPQAALDEGELIAVPVVQDWHVIESNWNLVLDSNLLHLELGSADQESPQRAECIDDDDYFLRNRDSTDTFYHHVDLNLPCKRQALTNVASSEYSSTPRKQDLFNELPDEVLLNVFRFMPRARDRASCALVCKRCLKLQSHLQRKDFYIKESQPDQHKHPMRVGDKKHEVVDEVHSQEAPPGSVKDVFDDVRVERQPQWAIGDLSRSLEGKKATDVRLAAIAVGTGGRGGLGKLCIKGGGFTGLSDEGLSAIGHCCAALQSLVLWDCPKITNKSITVIGEGCRLLQKVEVLKCPLVGDPGVSSIAKNAIFLSVLSLDECPLIGDAALHAVSIGCPELTHLNLRNCPLLGDDGLEAVMRNCKKLQNLKLHGLQISDGVLMSVGLHCKALGTFGVSNLNFVTEDGFLSFCNLSSARRLRRLAITSCPSFNDLTLAAVGNSFKSLKQISLTRCEGISDQGLMSLVQIAPYLEILHVERCNHITSVSLASALSSTTGRLKEIHMKTCDGIQDDNICLPAAPSFVHNRSVVRSICLADCGGVGDKCLSLVGCLCNDQLRDLDLTGLTHVTDRGLLAVLTCGWFKFASVNVTGCDKLTDRAISAIAKQCGGSLKSFVMDGCKRVTDVGLKAIGKHCVALEDLDISQCGVTDMGLQVVISKVGSTLISLNLSGCCDVTNQIFSFIEEGCQNLKDLNLKDCEGLTQRMISKFSARMWMCDILSV